MNRRVAHRWIALPMALFVGCTAGADGAAGNADGGWPRDPGAVDAGQPSGDDEAGAASGAEGGDTGGPPASEGAEAGAEDSAPSAEDAAEGGAPSAEGGEGADCGALQLLGLRAEDDDGDGDWQAGEVLWVQATLENIGEHDFFDYPGAVLQVIEGGVLVPEPTAWVYSLESGGRALLEWWVIGAPGEGAEGEVRLRAEVVTGACGRSPEPCPDAEPSELRLHLHPS